LADFWKMSSSPRKRGGADQNLSSWVIACPVQYNPPYKPGKKSALPLFFLRWEHFSKIGSRGSI
jgi:hypothetical protein